MCKKIKFVVFADDTLIYIVGTDFTLNIELESVAAWLEEINLNLNVNKTKCMVLANKNKPNIIQKSYLNVKIKGKVRGS